jgi:hypothetical protein
LKTLTSHQLAEWEAYNVLDPIGEERSDFRFSYLYSLLTNIAIRTYGKKGAELTKIDDFLFKWGVDEEEQKVQSLEDMKNVMMALVRSQEKSSDNKEKRRVRKIPPKKE